METNVISLESCLDLRQFWHKNDKDSPGSDRGSRVPESVIMSLATALNPLGPGAQTRMREQRLTMTWE